jgi:hypothetical protein
MQNLSDDVKGVIISFLPPHLVACLSQTWRKNVRSSLEPVMDCYPGEFMKSMYIWLFFHRVFSLMQHPPLKRDNSFVEVPVNIVMGDKVSTPICILKVPPSIQHIQSLIPWSNILSQTGDICLYTYFVKSYIEMGHDMSKDMFLVRCGDRIICCFSSEEGEGSPSVPCSVASPSREKDATKLSHVFDREEFWMPLQPLFERMTSMSITSMFLVELGVPFVAQNLDWEEEWEEQAEGSCNAPLSTGVVWNMNKKQYEEEGFPALSVQVHDVSS